MGFPYPLENVTRGRSCSYRRKHNEPQMDRSAPGRQTCVPVRLVAGRLGAGRLRPTSHTRAGRVDDELASPDRAPSLGLHREALREVCVAVLAVRQVTRAAAVPIAAAA